MPDSHLLKELQSIWMVNVLAQIYEQPTKATGDLHHDTFELAKIEAANFIRKKAPIYSNISNDLYTKKQYNLETFMSSTSNKIHTPKSFMKKATNCKSRFVTLCANWKIFLESYGEKTGEYSSGTTVEQRFEEFKLKHPKSK